MLRLPLAVAALVILGSCGVPPSESADSRYVFDATTHLCFRRSATTGARHVYAYVPCTDRVLRAIYPLGVPAEVRTAQALCTRGPE